MSVFMTAYRRRTASFDVTITEADGTAVVLTVGDAIRLKIGRAGSVPLLDLTSDAPSANGSTLTAANPTRLYLTQADATASPGVYDVEVSVVDASDGKIKHADSGVFALHETPLGGVD